MKMTIEITETPNGGTLVSLHHVDKPGTVAEEGIAEFLKRVVFDAMEFLDKNMPNQTKKPGNQ